MSEILTVENLVALLTLSALEIVLGIDNVVFLSILTARVDPAKRSTVRRVGLLLAMGMRIALLLALSWVMKLSTELFTLLEHPVTGRDLVLLGGGLFLLAKATWEIHHHVEGEDDEHFGGARTSIVAILTQIALLDIVFSLDSVITAIGMARVLWVMVAAVMLAVGVMMLFADPIGNFVERHPTMKMLALSFLLLIGVLLVAEGLGKHLERGYVYFAMGFSLVVELLNLRMRAKRRRGAA